MRCDLQVLQRQVTSWRECRRRRPRASEPQGGLLQARLDGSRKNVRVASAAGASSKSELDALCTRRWNACRWQRLYVRETHTTAVYGPRRGYILSAGAFKQGLCEYLFKLPFSAARARQSTRRARQTLRPASRYTDGRYRRPPPVCNCVSGSREPKRALTEQQDTTNRSGRRTT